MKNGNLLFRRVKSINIDFSVEEAGNDITLSYLTLLTRSQFNDISDTHLLSSVIDENTAENPTASLIDLSRLFMMSSLHHQWHKLYGIENFFTSNLHAFTIQIDLD